MAAALLTAILLTHSGNNHNKCQCRLEIIDMSLQNIPTRCQSGVVDLLGVVGLTPIPGSIQDPGSGGLWEADIFIIYWPLYGVLV